MFTTVTGSRFLLKNYIASERKVTSVNRVWRTGETMGMCLPCLGGSVEDYDQPDPETRRQQQAEAAMKRQRDNESRGVKDAEGLKRKQQRREEIEKKAEMQGGDNAMKWQVG